MSKQQRGDPCECVVYHRNGNWYAFDRCSFRAKEELAVETAPSWFDRERRGVPVEPRTIKVCGVHARELRQGKTVDRITGWGTGTFRSSPKWEDVRLPAEETA